MERYRIFAVITVGILFLLSSFTVAFYVGIIVVLILGGFDGMGIERLGIIADLTLVVVELLGLAISLAFVVKNMKRYNKSYLNSLYIFIPAVIALVYIMFLPINLPHFHKHNYLIDFLYDHLTIGFLFTILGCILFGFLLSWLLPSHKEGVTQNPGDQ